MLLPFGYVHSSTIIKYKGRVFVTYFAGSREGAKDVHIWLQNVTEGTLTKITDLDGPHWNPVLFEWKDSLYLAYKEGPHPWDWQTRIVLIGSIVNDMHESHFDHTIDGGPVKNKPIIMSNGQLIAGHSTEHNGWKCYASLLEPTDWHNDVGYHLDARETWKNIPIDSTTVPGRGVIQPTLWESEPGHIHMFMRSAMGHICRADSKDFGRTWCPAYPVDELLNNNSGIDVVTVGQVHVDKGMMLYLVSNPVKGEMMTASTRSPLTIMRSSDNGFTWDKWASGATKNMGVEKPSAHYALEFGEGEYSYPAIIHDPETNSLLVSYTYNKHSIKLETIPLGV